MREISIFEITINPVTKEFVQYFYEFLRIKLTRWMTKIIPIRLHNNNNNN